MAGDGELNCLFLGTVSPGEEKKIRSSRSHPPRLCFYSPMRDEWKKPLRLLAILSLHPVSRGAEKCPGVVRPGGHITLHVFCFLASSLVPCSWRWDSR